MARKTTLSKDAEPLIKIVNGAKARPYRAKQTIFSQGDPSDAVFYILKGRVKLTVISERGKEAIVGILDHGAFVGEPCLAGQPVRIMTATALEECSIIRIEKGKMMRILRSDPEISERFVSHLLYRNMRIHEDLVDHLFNDSEKRLARLLLLLAHYGKNGKAEPVIPKVSQETLAEMVGTTRSRVSFFMNRFRKLGFIDYNGGLEVHTSLLNMVLHD
jgi:CRP/FNR family transcriptional regulator, cyclic AMP receptor protein